ncbi:MAG: DUF3048 domain-containing protein [Actinomycetales bacterium]
MTAPLRSPSSRVPGNRRRALTATAFALVAATGLSACSGASPKPVAVKSSSAVPAQSTSSAAPSTAAASTTATGLTSPLTGLPVTSLAPVLAVKIGNTRPERPPIGLDSADVVYVEMVEGGLTRILALFSSHVPAKVGPVRSARETDVQLLAQYGKVALAYSGSDTAVVPMLRSSGMKLLSFDAGRGYRRDASRGHAPYNVVGNAPQLLSYAPGAAKAKDMGWTFATAAPAGGSAVSSMTARWPLATVSATWQASGKHWGIAVDGGTERTAAGVALHPATVLVQYVDERTLGRRDAARTPVPYAQTVGSGTGLVLRDGKAYQARWSRPSAGAPTAWTVGGQPAVFAPGQVWVLMVPKGRTVSVR